MGPRAPSSLQLNKEGDHKCPDTSLLQPQKRKKLQTDASIKGLVACLLQEGKPVYFASKALTEAQKGYAAIGLESLVVVWAIEKFHHFLFGNHFIIETDQKLLEAILSKSLNEATPWLQIQTSDTFMCIDELIANNLHSEEHSFFFKFF